MKLKGAYWPELRKVASAKLQLELGCNPSVAHVFHPSMQLTAVPSTLAIHVGDATLEQWEEMAGEWEVDQMNSPITDLGLDQVHLH